MSTEMSPTNATDKSAEIEEVENGFVVQITGVCTSTEEYFSRKYIFHSWDEMESELRAWFIGTGPAE